MSYTLCPNCQTEIRTSKGSFVICPECGEDVRPESDRSIEMDTEEEFDVLPEEDSLDKGEDE